MVQRLVSADKLGEVIASSFRASSSPQPPWRRTLQPGRPGPGARAESESALSFFGLTCNRLVAYYDTMSARVLPVPESPDVVFKALADSGRRRLLDRLRMKGGLTLGELCDGMGMTRQGVTKHLSLLEEARLVVALRKGREKQHYLNPVPIHEIAERWIRPFERCRLDALRDLKVRLER